MGKMPTFKSPNIYFKPNSLMLKRNFNIAVLMIAFKRMETEIPTNIRMLFGFKNSQKRNKTRVSTRLEKILVMFRFFDASIKKT